MSSISVLTTIIFKNPALAPNRASGGGGDSSVGTGYGRAYTGANLGRSFIEGNYTYYAPSFHMSYVYNFV